MTTIPKLHAGGITTKPVGVEARDGYGCPQFIAVAARFRHPVKIKDEKGRVIGTAWRQDHDGSVVVDWNRSLVSQRGYATANDRPTEHYLARNGKLTASVDETGHVTSMTIKLR